MSIKEVFLRLKPINFSMGKLIVCHLYFIHSFIHTIMLMNCLLSLVLGRHEVTTIDMIPAITELYS